MLALISSIRLENVRGVREGELRELRELTVLTGHNGCGKSTVLDALLIGASPQVGDAVGRAVSRHPASTNGARWLFRSAVQATRTEVVIDGVALHRSFRRLDDAVPEWGGARLQRLTPPITSISVEAKRAVEPSGWAFTGEAEVVAVDVRNEYVAARLPAAGGQGAFVRLVDPGIPIRLSTSYSAAVRAGRKAELVALIGRVLPEVRDLELLEDAPGEVSLHLVQGVGGVPSALAGDGVQALLQIAVELASAPDGTVLLEEPEVYQHPRALEHTAGVVVAAVLRGVQVVLTTHSLDFIDALLRAATALGLPPEQLALFNLARREEVLHSARHSGAELGFARESLELDPR